MNAASGRPKSPTPPTNGDRDEPLDLAYLAAMQEILSEWSSPEDAAAYDDL